MSQLPFSGKGKGTSKPKRGNLRHLSVNPGFEPRSQTLGFRIGTNGSWCPFGQGVFADRTGVGSLEPGGSRTGTLAYSWGHARDLHLLISPWTIHKGF